MRVEVADEVFTRADPDPAAVHAVYDLLKAFERGQHDWMIDAFGVDAVAAYLPRHHPTLADTYAAMARMASVQIAYTGTTQRVTPVRVTVDDLDDHAADLCRPAVVVVEDLENDGQHFLPTLAHAFGADRVRVALERGWLEVRHSGGTGRIPAVAAAEAARFRRLVRVVAFMDSDREWPDHESSTLRSAAKKARDLPIEVHVLACREAENYAPDKVLRVVGRRAESAVKVAALGRLPRQYRRHVDIKNGFRKKQVPEQRSAFGPVDPAVERDLTPGFGAAVLRTMFEMRLALCEDDFVATDPEAADDLRKLLALIDSRI